MVLLVGPTYLFFTLAWTIPQLQRRRLATASATKCAKDLKKTPKTPGRSKHHHRRKNTKPSPTHHQNITAPSPHITETSPKHARDITNTSLIVHQKTLKKPTKQHQNNKETSPNKTETRPRHDRDITETRQREDQDKTETRPRHSQDITETSLRHHQNTPRHHRDKT